MDRQISGLFGMFCPKTRTQVPLQSIDVTAAVRGFVAETTSTLMYKNSSSDHIEAVFTFPVQDSSAVYRFEAELDGRTIVSEVQEKDQAKETFEDAISQGHTATLLEESESAGDIFHCKVGNLGPNKEAKLTISMVTELRLTTDGAVTFTLPTVLCPRYNPRVEDGGIPKTTKTQNMTHLSVPYSFHFGAVVESSDPILEIKCSKDGIHCDFINDDKTTAKISLTSTFVPDHDLSFDVYFSKPHEPKIYLEKGIDGAAGFLKSDVAMVNFFPEMMEESYSSAQELIFVIDRSGSMSGGRIKSAKDTLLLLLKSMPVGCFFNVVSFGSRHETLFPEGSRQYGEDTLAEACDLQASMDANLGGTEILSPLRDIYSKPLMSSHARQILLLTDGEVSNTNQVIKLVEKHSSTTRLFSFGIGDGASTSLVDGVARAGHGKAEYVRGGDRLQSKVMKTMKAAMQASVSDIHLVCPPGVDLIQIPLTIPPIFSGEKLVVFAVVSRAEAVGTMTLALKGKIGDEAFESSSSAGEGSVVDGHSSAIHRLAAKAQIKELEANESGDNEEKIVLLSTAANIISRYTSMVGVDKDNKEKIGNLIHHDIVLVEEDMETCYSATPDTYSFGTFDASLDCVDGAIDCVDGAIETGSGQRKKSKGSIFSAISAPARAAYKNAKKKIKRKSAPAPLQCDLACDAACSPAVYSRNSSATPDGMIDISFSHGSLSEAEQKEPFTPSYMDLVALQSFCGSWKLDQKLAGVLKKDLKKIGSASPISDKEVWGTILAIVFLEDHYSQERDEWEMVVRKAELWLSGQADKMEGSDVTMLKTTAKTFQQKK